MSLIVNETRLPATVKRLFRNSVYEIVGELLQNAQRAGASRIDFIFDRDSKTIRVRDDGSGIAPDAAAWARVLRMADSFYQNPAVEPNQNPMGLGLLSLFALEAARKISINSNGKIARLDVERLWESGDYWASWTNLIEDAPAPPVDGFEITVEYDEPDDAQSYNQLAHKFEYALTKAGDGYGRHAAARGYDGFLEIYLDGSRVDASLPAECVRSGDDLLLDTTYESNRLRIGQSARGFGCCHAHVVWYGQIIRFNSAIPFLLEVKSGSPVTPLAPTRTELINDEKLKVLRKFVEDQLFARLANETVAARLKPAFVRNLFQSYPQRAAAELPVCVVKEMNAPGFDSNIESYSDFCILGAERVLSYREIQEQKLDVFDSAVAYFLDAEKRADARYKYVGGLADDFEPPTATSGDESETGWFDAPEGLASFAGLVGGTIREFVAGDRRKLRLKRIYWKPGKRINEFFCEPGEFAVAPVGSLPAEKDFRPVGEQVFAFQYPASRFIEDVEGLCVAVPNAETATFADEAARWLEECGRICFSPDDDYDYDQQETDFDDSIARLILDLRGDVLSTNWSFNELKAVVGKIVAERADSGSGAKRDGDARIKTIEISGEKGEAKITARLADETEISLRVAACVYLT